MLEQERNFLRDQSGMRTQLLTLDHLVQLMDPQLYLHLQSADSTNFFFFFRMLLVWYKREFDWGDILRLWETLWTDYLSSNFHMFIALAILEKHRDVIMDHLKHFDEVLKYSTSSLTPGPISTLTNAVNELSNTMELVPILTRAESLFRRFQRAVEAIDKKNNFPAPSAVQRRPTQNASDTDKGKSPQQPSASAAASSSVSVGAAPPWASNESRVISPELRELLSKEIFWKHEPSNGEPRNETT
jgi:hypothetical protein